MQKLIVLNLRWLSSLCDMTADDKQRLLHAKIWGLLKDKVLLQMFESETNF